MSNCCSDPTEISKLDPRELVREQTRHGDLQRELFTSDPEKLMLHELREASTYLRELAALRAYYDSVRLAAIALLDQSSASVVQRIIDKEPETEVGKAAAARLQKIQ
ncbi:hypothetical protein [methanotrophic endosymbiont of Bathymodiolus puteoserpentis (Logatchev)]|jgi:hypothetical protein|uniref:hypothetical protein n=1 Tax=methanotrophic endosymbiont of Bathymodiolus puteoserpentis (Logatchev) TaxID=343235 RepID=UPI0013C8BD3B|nr:hypothetical protein [methanotrophic endosymbiont of Bathymodiolus puteoserpentis (Logatchev)]SHE21805.1 hypothetical protein BPUTEOMOX_551 [methanotrophic endosymbiont of Bathymodiolus puteoserpentis (Logatchev)]